MDHNAWLVLVCDTDTATWTILANCSVAKMGADEAKKRTTEEFENLRLTGDMSPAYILYTGDFIQFQQPPTL